MAKNIGYSGAGAPRRTTKGFAPPPPKPSAIAPTGMALQQMLASEGPPPPPKVMGGMGANAMQNFGRSNHMKAKPGVPVGLDNVKVGVPQPPLA